MNSNLVKNLFYIIIFFSPLVFFTDLTRNPYYFQIVFAQAGMVVIWIIIILKQKGKLELKSNPFEMPMLIFYCWAILTWLISLTLLNHHYLNPELIIDSLKVYHKNYLKYSMFNEGFKKLLFTITNILMVYFFATNYINKKNFARIYNIFFIVGFIASIYGIMQYFGIEFVWSKVLNPFGGRCVSTFGNPNFLSSYLILLFPISFAYFVSGTNTLFMTIFMITSFSALMATLTRSSWLGLGLSLILFIIILFVTQKDVLLKRKKRILLLSAVFAILFIFWPQSPVGGSQTPLSRMAEIKESVNIVYPPVHQRLLIWFCGWDMIKEKIFTGKGWGLYELFYPFYQGKYLFLPTFSLRTHANNAHNEIIETWAQTGTIGLGIYILFYTTLFIYGYKLIKSIPDNQNKLLITGLVVSIVGMLVDNLLNVTIHFCIPAFLYFFNIGVIPTFDDSRKTKVVELKQWGTILTVIFGCLIIYRLVFNFLGEINYFKGFKYSKRGELDLALKYLSKANKFQRYEVNNNYELANTCARIKKVDDAIHYYYESLASNCGYDEIHFNLATVYSQVGNSNMAKLHYSQALWINPVSKEAYMALGGIFLSNLDENLQPAIKLFEQAVMLFPDNKDFYNNLGYLYVRAGNEKQALEHYYNALKIDPNFEFAKRNYLMLAKKLNLKDDPLKKYENLVTQLNDKVSQNNFDDATKICNSILEIFPNDTLAKFYLANIHFSKGELDTAIKKYQELISLNPDNLNARYNLALAYIQQKNFYSAREHLQYILSRAPNNDQARKQLEAISNFP